MGNVTVTLDKRRSIWGDMVIVLGRITMSSSYATSGDSYTLGQLGVSVLNKLFIVPRGAYHFAVDYTNKKILAYGQEPTSATTGIIALSQVANAADLSAQVLDFIAIGTWSK